MLVVHNSGEVIHIIHSSIHKAQVSTAFRPFSPALQQLMSYQYGVISDFRSALGGFFRTDVLIQPLTVERCE